MIQSGLVIRASMVGVRRFALQVATANRTAMKGLQSVAAGSILICSFIHVRETICSGMERIEKTVFLSYRRTNITWALAVFQNLTQHGFDVFFDYSGISSGDFERIILGNIAGRAHFLVLLTPSALERCDDPNDWLRREIETALASKRNTVPLMLEGFDFSTPAIASQLTGGLAALKRYNGLSIPSEYFLEAMERLRSRYLAVPLTAVLHPVSASAQECATLQKAAADAAPAVQEKDLAAQQRFERGFAAVSIDDKLRYYTDAIRLKPDYPAAFYNRGIARYVIGDLHGALNDQTAAIRLKPDNAAAFYNRGIARRATGDLQGALDDCSEAIRLKPDYAAAFHTRGVVRHVVGDLEGALEDYTEAIRQKPHYAAALHSRGVVRHATGDLSASEHDFSDVIQLNLQYSDAFYNRGLTREGRGDLSGAIQDYSEAIRLSPDDALAFYNRGVARQAQGDLQGALRDYGEALRLKPNDVIAFYERGVARATTADLERVPQDDSEPLFWHIDERGEGADRRS